MMQRYFSIMFSYLLLAPGIALCYAPMKEYLRYSIRRMVLLGTGLLAVMIPLCTWLEYEFLTYSNSVFLPFCLILYAVYQKTLNLPPYQSITVFSTVMVLLSYMANFSIMIDSRLHPTGVPRNDNLTNTVIQLILSMLLAGVIFYPMKKYGEELIATFHDKKVYYTATVISCIFFLISLFLMPVKYETLYVNNVFRSYVISVSSTFLLHILLCVIFYFIISGMTNSQKMAEQNKFYEMRESYYLKQQRYIIENARVRHDFKHTIRALKNLADKEDYTELKAYLNQYFESLPENDSILFCDNHAVNAVLNYYYLVAEKSKIKTNWSIEIPDNIQIKNVDLCNIIGNILDNAITACEEIPEEQRWIQFTITNQHHANLYFVATNSFNGKVKMFNDCYLSTHRDGNGIGLSSIESIAENYNGTAIFNHKEKEFYSNVVLPIM